MAINKKGIIMTLVGGVIAAFGVGVLAKKNKDVDANDGDFIAEEIYEEPDCEVEAEESEA